MIDKAIFAAGCFWGVEENFVKIQGVASTKVGYTGGRKENPSYEEVCTGKTGHAESVLLEFDSSILSYSSLLNFFWKFHDPTTLNRQGVDVGSQYRSAIFYFNLNQKNLAIESKKNISSKYNNKIVTEITEAKYFYLAEEYHQRYLKKKYNL